MRRNFWPAFLLCSTVAMFGGCGDSNSPEARQRAADDAKFGSEVDARIQAQKLVESVLKHPDDANFSWLSNARLSEPHGSKGLRNWIVTGKVTAPNDFGAKLTKPYQVTLCVDGGQWNCLAIFYDGQVVYENGKAIAQQVADIVAAEPREVADNEPEPAAREPAAVVVDQEAAVRRSIEARRKGPLFEQRTWLVKGSEVVGTLKSFGAGKVRIESEAGDVLQLTEADLSPADMAFIRTNFRQ
ncbi:MAG: hypothetical protein QM775_16525 [Pirellulales bacterium]